MTATRIDSGSAFTHTANGLWTPHDALLSPLFTPFTPYPYTKGRFARIGA